MAVFVGSGLSVHENFFFAKSTIYQDVFHKQKHSLLFTTFHTENLIVVIVQKSMVVEFINNLSERIITIITMFYSVPDIHNETLLRGRNTHILIC